MLIKKQNKWKQTNNSNKKRNLRQQLLSLNQNLDLKVLKILINQNQNKRLRVPNPLNKRVKYQAKRFKNLQNHKKKRHQSLLLRDLPLKSQKKIQKRRNKYNLWKKFSLYRKNYLQSKRRKIKKFFQVRFQNHQQRKLKLGKLLHRRRQNLSLRQRNLQLNLNPQKPKLNNRFYNKSRKKKPNLKQNLKNL